MADLPDLTEEQWEELLERLTWHAQRKYLRLVWQGIPATRGGKAPGGIEPADIAVQAILDTLERRRTWNQTVEPDFLEFLKGVVDSKLSHLARVRENRSVRSAPLPESLPSKEMAPEHAVVEEEELVRLQHILFNVIEGDPLVQQVLTCLEAGVTKPATMATRIGVDVRDIYNAQRRLRHKIRCALSPN